MYYRPQDKALLSSDGEVLRRFHCPMEGQELNMRWENSNTLRCPGCRHSVRVVWDLDETKLRTLMKEEPDICLLIPSSTEQITLLEY